MILGGVSDRLFYMGGQGRFAGRTDVRTKDISHSILHDDYSLARNLSTPSRWARRFSFHLLSYDSITDHDLEPPGQ
jgi:hypothetical protein